MDIARSSDGIEITHLADLYPEHLEKSRATLGGVPDNMKVTKDTMHAGVDAYKKVIESDVDVVLLCHLPALPPQTPEAAVNAGKHIFAEKPIAVDPAGVRRFVEAGKKAKEKAWLSWPALNVATHRTTARGPSRTTGRSARSPAAPSSSAAAGQHPSHDARASRIWPG